MRHWVASGVLEYEANFMLGNDIKHMDDNACGRDNDFHEGTT